MISSNRRASCIRQWSIGAGLAAAAMIGTGTAHADTADDVVGQTLAAASTANQYDPAVFDYSADPSNLFAPVYTVAPVGPEEATSTVTDPNNLDTTDTFGTQDFSLSSLGFPVDTFTGNVEYTPTPFDGATGLSGILSQLSQDFGLPGGYSEEITTLGGTGTVLPDVILTPFGDENITPIVDLFLPQGVGITDAVDPSSFADLLSSIGL
jgi:hypothetical protein